MHRYVIETFDHKSPVTSESRSIQEIAVESHILSCDFCLNVKFDLNDFSILRKCKLEFHTRLHKAVFIRKSNPNFNCQLYANGITFLHNLL